MGEMVSPQEIPLEWHVPGEQEMMVVNKLLERYLGPSDEAAAVIL